jgi:hypothetical protein
MALDLYRDKIREEEPIHRCINPDIAAAGIWPPAASD